MFYFVLTFFFINWDIANCFPILSYDLVFYLIKKYIGLE